MIQRISAFLRLVLAAGFIATAGGTVAQQPPPTAYQAARTGGNYMHNFYLPPPSTTTPRRPAWSPDGEALAFALHGSIWRMRLGERTAYELTDNETYDSSPAWSPDGAWIAYTAETDNRTIDLMVLNVETGVSRPLKTGDHLYLDPTWSPDGSRLAYVSTEPNGYFNIFVQDMADGGAAGDPIQLTRDNDYGRSRLYFGAYDLHIEPSWSPDGSELMFIGNRGIPLGSGAVWRMPVEPFGIDRARIVLEEQTLYRTRPHWSPDGSRFVYASHRGGQYTKLYLLPADGGHPYKITFGDWDDFYPRWSPDGSRIAYITNENGLPGLRIMETVGGKLTDIVIEEKRWRGPHGRAAVTVLDGETGKPATVRVYARASDGKSYAAEGAYHRVGRLREHFFHAPGSFILDVPTGPLTVEAMKGFEYHPASTTVEIEDGKTTAVALTLRRMTDLRKKGWYSGSTHIHMNYAGDLHNTLENLMHMSEAEDQSVVNELVANKDNRMLDYQFFTGKPDALSTPAHVLHVGEEYRPAFHGHVYFIGLSDFLLSPFASGYEGTAIYSLYPSNTDMLRLAGEQGAFRAYVHPYFGEADPLGGENPTLGSAKAFPVDAALGTVEALEISGAGHAVLDVWHHLLNNDINIVLTGGEDSISSMYRTAIVGQVRSYVYLGDEPLSWDAWLSALRTGRTFATNGPLLEFTIDDAMPGEVIRLPKEGGAITLRGTVRSIVPLEKVTVYRNGRILKEIPLSGEGTEAVFEEEITVRESGWYTLQAEGAPWTHPIDDRYPLATTQSIRVYAGDDPIRNPDSARYFVRWIDRLIEMAEAHPGWRSQEEIDHVIGQFREARAIYENLAR
ncbi:MAG: CehA/McbA family metallohydrolase [Gemmatimonadota bacterium]|nr:CehA/McbA family metallohydrolase [Gemmatimonadota bacterium]